MANPDFASALRDMSHFPAFRNVLSASEDQLEQQRDMEYASRFLVNTFVPYESKLDVEAYIDAGILQLASDWQPQEALPRFEGTFELLDEAMGDNALRRQRQDGVTQGRVGLAAFECIAIGVGRNYPAIIALPAPVAFVQQKIFDFWRDDTPNKFFVAGLRGTRRLQLTLPFGERLFRP